MKEGVETNADGNVILRPLTGWMTNKVADMYVLLRLQYIERPEDFGEKEQSTPQVTLTAPQCLELAEALQRAGKSLLDSGSRKPQ